jgi:hypothetical protein
MKPNRSTKYIYLSAMAFILLITAAACGQASDNAAVSEITPDTDIPVENQTTEVTDPASGDENESTASVGDNLDETDIESPSGELSPEEAEGLVFMREEEKLARDVYLTLSEIWGLPVFNNIAQSEATHMEAVLSLLNQYGLEDPAATTDIGVFTNPTLQELYDQLVAEGSQSLADALRVGAAIEEIDILDLEKYVAQTQREDIAFVYNNLMKGSRNHLGAFVQNLERRSGETYQPQFLDQDAYAVIINASVEKGGWGNGQRGNGRWGNP